MLPVTFPLRVLAGDGAWQHVRERGLCLDDFDVFVAPAGGTKVLMLGGLDRVLFSELRRARRDEPFHAIGSSIGSFRLACLASSDPSSALERLARFYIDHDFDRGKAHTRSVAAKAATTLLAGEEKEKLADPPFARLHFLTSLCSGLSASERAPFLAAGLGLAALGNFLDRRMLGLGLTRVVFHSRGDAGPFGGLKDLPTRHSTLSSDNFEQALVASAAVPFLVPGVRVPGGPRGVHRDGALIDYHPVLPVASDALVLYPHFFGHCSPGWFDRALPGRRANGQRRTVLLCPAESFVSRLPGGVRPSRRDAGRMPHRDRARRWEVVWKMSDELGAALGELLASRTQVNAVLERL